MILTCIDCGREFDTDDYPPQTIKDPAQIKRCTICFLKAFDLLFLECDLVERGKLNPDNFGLALDKDG